MTSIIQKLSDRIAAAFISVGLPAELGVVRVSDRPELCQFQCNGAMPAAKQAGKPPREIAQDIITQLENKECFAELEIAGPGFININITDEFLTEHLTALPEPTPKNQIIVLDYGGYTIAKPLHVGHLRSTIIGDSLKRIHKAAGYNTLGDVHLADWGTQMGMIISELEIRYPEWPYFDPEFEGEYPKDPPITLAEYAEIYPAASKSCKEDDARMERARAATFDLQEGRKGYRALWRHMLSVSIIGIQGHLSNLGVEFELWRSEGDVHDLIPPMAAAMKHDQIAYESKGALVVDVAQDDDKKEIPPLILLKSDGAVLYSTTDLATIIDRVETHDPEKIIYIVDQRQSLHFEQVFRVAQKAALVKDNRPELIFAGFGTMNGTDGKPFKTRAGGVMRLGDLIAMAVEKAQTRLGEANLADDIDEDERAEIADKVALAAIKFADLQNQRQSDYVFDLDRMTSFEGKTGPYLLYQAVRIQSLLKKAGDTPSTVHQLEDASRPLALLLMQLPDQFDSALNQLAPHILCDYAYKLAQEFSSFYANCHILSEEDEDLRNSRLALCALTHRQLIFVLGLLGIEVPARM